MNRYLAFTVLILLICSCQELEDIKKAFRYDDHDSAGDFALKGRKWSKTSLTYYFESDNAVMNAQTVRQAFDIWQKNSNLTFTQVNQKSQADIKLSFARGEHGDDRPFDGKGGVLAHGFFPPPTQNAGIIHFDGDNTWSLHTDQLDSEPIDWVTVAAHEIGHTLGLNHSENPSALMFADYVGSHRFLDQDDKSGICAIYGCTPNNGGGGSSATIPINGLVAYYSFENNLNDLSGNNNHGIGKGTISYESAIKGKGLKLRGVNSPTYKTNPDHVFIPNNSFLQFSNAFTVSYWVRIDGNRIQTYANCTGDIVAGIGGAILSKDGDRNGWYFSEWETSTGFGIIPWNGGNGAGTENIVTAYQNFRHITYTLNGTNIKIYVNGQLVKNTNGSNINFTVPNQRNMYIGVHYNGQPYTLGSACLDYWGQFNGIIDELRIYNRPLTDSEVKNLYQ